MILPITLEPNPLLHKVSKNLTAEEINSKITKEFIGNLIETMYVKDGVGIASVQVGNPIQLCVIAKILRQKSDDLILINPSFKNFCLGLDEEGCLSVPNIYGSVRRFNKIKVSALNSTGEKLNL